MYFNEKGSVNTEKSVELAKENAAERGIKNIVVASGTGDTAFKFKNMEGYNIVCVTHAYGFEGPGQIEITNEAVKELKDSGIKVLTTSHVLSGAERGISKIHGGISPVQIVAEALRMLGQGVKVCVEISVMALDAGLIPYGEEIIAVAGSSTGADTVVIIKPEHANNILETKVCEIICKPRNF